MTNTIDALGALHVDAEMEGLGLAEQQAVERRGPVAAATTATSSANGSDASTLGQLAPDRLPSIHSVRSRSSRSSLA